MIRPKKTGDIYQYASGKDNSKDIGGRRETKRIPRLAQPIMDKIGHSKITKENPTK